VVSSEGAVAIYPLGARAGPGRRGVRWHERRVISGSRAVAGPSRGKSQQKSLWTPVSCQQPLLPIGAVILGIALGARICSA
jgi:hypothetical protein